MSSKYHISVIITAVCQTTESLAKKNLRSGRGRRRTITNYPRSDRKKRPRFFNRLIVFTVLSYLFSVIDRFFLPATQRISTSVLASDAGRQGT